MGDRDTGLHGVRFKCFKDLRRTHKAIEVANDKLRMFKEVYIGANVLP